MSELLTEESVPVKRVKKGKIAKTRPVDEYKILPLAVEKILVDPSMEGAVILLNHGKKTVAYGLTASDTTMLTFARSGFGKIAHIRPLPYLYVASMTDMGNTLVAAVIEAKVGDIFYARLKWRGPNSECFFNNVSVGDALVLAAIVDIPISAVKRVFDEWDEFDWPYQSQGTYMGEG